MLPVVRLVTPRKLVEAALPAKVEIVQVAQRGIRVGAQASRAEQALAVVAAVALEAAVLPAVQVARALAVGAVAQANQEKQWAGGQTPAHFLPIPVYLFYTQGSLPLSWANDLRANEVVTKWHTTGF